MRPAERTLPNHWSADLDRLTRNCNQRQTVGIAIGPDTSRIISELILSRVDAELTSAGTDFLVKHGYEEQYGARPLKRAIQRFVEDPLSDKILVGEFSRGDELEVDVTMAGDALEFRVLTSSPKA